MMSPTNVTVSSGELHLLLCWEKENKSHEKTHFHVQMSAEFKLLNRFIDSSLNPVKRVYLLICRFCKITQILLRDEGKRKKILNTFFYLLSSDTEISMQNLPGK